MKNKHTTDFKLLHSVQIVHPFFLCFKSLPSFVNTAQLLGIPTTPYKILISNSGDINSYDLQFSNTLTHIHINVYHSSWLNILILQFALFTAGIPLSNNSLCSCCKPFPSSFNIAVHLMCQYNVKVKLQMICCCLKFKVRPLQQSTVKKKQQKNEMFVKHILPPMMQN